MWFHVQNFVIAIVINYLIIIIIIIVIIILKIFKYHLAWVLCLLSFIGK